MAAVTKTNLKRAAHSALDEASPDGKFMRVDAGFRNIISEDNAQYPPEAGRYHLYISWACPWANRTAALRTLKGLQDIVSMSVVHPTWQKTSQDPDDNHYGWAFLDADAPASRGVVPPSGHGLIPWDGATIDHVNNVKFIRDVYELSKDTFGKYSVPVLFDKKTNMIVNNESAEIVRMFNGPLAKLAGTDKTTPDMCPADLADTIEAANSWIYPNINNGVYRCGFAKSQSAYDEAVSDLNGSLDRLEALLATQRYIADNARITEADIRAFMTLVRFDEVYVVYFKTNCRPISQYPNIRNYCRELFQQKFIRENINMDHIKRHYFTSHPSLNTYSVIPKGPGVVEDLGKPHDRDRF